MSESGFRSAVIASAAVLGFALFYLRFCGAEDVPPLPPAPQTTIADAKQTALKLGERSDVYAQRLKDDSRRFDVREPPTIEEMSRRFPHAVDRTAHVLKNGDDISVLDLRLSLAVKEIGRRTRQMELVIENRSDSYVAYRIVTRPSKGTASCSKKEFVRHNAIVLAPKQIVRRSECIYRKGYRLEIGKVETVMVPQLSYFYLSAMPPIELAIDPRVVSGHRPPTGVSRCQAVLPAKVKRSLERGEVLWRDLVDFFARHTCEEYRFPHDYRAFDEDGARKLPIPGSVL